MSKLNDKEVNLLRKNIAEIQKMNEVILQNQASLHAASVTKAAIESELNAFHNRISDKYCDGKPCQINLETLEVTEVADEKEDTAK